MSKRRKQPDNVYELAIIEDDAKAVTIKILKPGLSTVAPFEEAELRNDWDSEITGLTNIDQFVADLNERFVAYRREQFKQDKERRAAAKEAREKKAQALWKRTMSRRQRIRNRRYGEKGMP